MRTSRPDGRRSSWCAATFVAAVPGSLRGQAFGLALGGMYLGQGAVMTVVLPLPGTPTPLRLSPRPGLPGRLLLSLSRSAAERAYAQIVLRMADLRSLLARSASA